MIKKQLSRSYDKYDLPTLNINASFNGVEMFDATKDIELVGYKYYPAIKAQVAI